MRSTPPNGYSASTLKLEQRSTSRPQPTGDRYRKSPRSGPVEQKRFAPLSRHARQTSNADSILIVGRRNGFLPHSGLAPSPGGPSPCRRSPRLLNRPGEIRLARAKGSLSGQAVTGHPAHTALRVNLPAGQTSVHGGRFHDSRTPNGRVPSGKATELHELNCKPRGTTG